MNHMYLTHFHVVDLYLQGKGFPGGAAVKNPPANPGGPRDIDPWVEKIPLEEEMATHSSILAWKIPCTEKPGPRGCRARCG